MLSAASARSPRGLVKLTLIALAAGAVVTPALGSEHSGDRMQEPTGLKIAEATATSLTLRWDADETATSYRVFEEGDLVGTTASPEFTLDGLECGRSYELAAQAVDVDGRHSERVRVTAASAPCAPPPDTPPAPPPVPAPPPPPPQAQAIPETTGPPPPEPQPATAPEPIPPAPVPANVWQTAGVFVWHEGAVDPETLGQELKDNGFGWAAVQLHDGLSVDPVQEDWIRRFRAASGLPVGGWGVLRTEPVREAQLAQSLLARYGLGFYIADAETEYKYSSDTGYSDVRYARSREFVDAFRAALPDMPAAVSSYCRADREDIEWQSWADGGFDFLPQAYVNDLGGYVTPATCAEGAAKWFPPDAVHPTIGAYPSNDPAATPAEYAKLLQTAHTVGFSVYLAETQQKDPQGWNVLGQAITELGIALPGGMPVAPDPTTTEPQADWHGAGY